MYRMHYVYRLCSICAGFYTNTPSSFNTPVSQKNGTCYLRRFTGTSIYYRDTRAVNRLSKNDFLRLNDGGKGTPLITNTQYTMNPITRMFQEGALVREDDGRVRCECGSVVLSASLRGHLKSKKHTKFQHSKVNAEHEHEDEHEDEHECGICCEVRSSFFKCSTCRNDHCMDCHKSIRNNKCPFCRTPYSSVVAYMSRAEMLDMMQQMSMMSSRLADWIATDRRA